jgi:hypothetical protein
MTVRFRIYTEYRENLSGLAGVYFPEGFSLIHTAGYWQGHAEDSAIIEKLGTVNDTDSVLHLANDIRILNKQTNVYVTYEPTTLIDVTVTR